VFKIDIIKKFEKIKNELIDDAVALETETEDALAIFQDTLTQLEDVESKIDTKLLTLENCMSSLQMLKDKFKENKLENGKIKQKLTEFLK